MIGQFSHDVIGWKTRVKFVISQWSVSIYLLVVKLHASQSIRSLFVGFIYIVNKLLLCLDTVYEYNIEYDFSSVLQASHYHITHWTQHNPLNLKPTQRART